MRRRTGPRTELLEPRLVLSALRLQPVLAPADPPAGTPDGTVQEISDPLPGADPPLTESGGVSGQSADDSPGAFFTSDDTGSDTAGITPDNESDGDAASTGSDAGPGDRSPPGDPAAGADSTNSMLADLEVGTTAVDDGATPVQLRRTTSIDAEPAVISVGSVTISDAAVVSIAADADAVSVRSVEDDSGTVLTETSAGPIRTVDADIVDEDSRADIDSEVDEDPSVVTEDSDELIARDGSRGTDEEAQQDDDSITDLQRPSDTKLQNRTESSEAVSVPDEKRPASVLQQQQEVAAPQGERADDHSQETHWIDGVAESFGDWLMPVNEMLAGDGAESGSVHLLAAGGLVPLLALARKTSADTENTDAKSSSDSTGIIDRKWWKDRRRNRPTAKIRRQTQRRDRSSRNTVVDGGDSLDAPDISEAFAMSVMTPFNGDDFIMKPLEPGRDSSPTGNGGLDASVGVGAGAAIATATAAGVARQRAKRARPKSAKPVISYSGTTREFPS